MFTVELRMFTDSPQCVGMCVRERKREMFCMHTVYSGGCVQYM